MTLHAPTAASHYDRVSESWRLVMGEDFHFGYFTSPNESLAQATRRLTHFMAESVALRKEDVVLDVGCGVAGPAIELAQTYSCQVLGLTNSRAGFEQSLANVRTTALESHVKIEFGDVTHAPLEGQPCSVAWLEEMSHLVENKAQLWSYCANRVQPGGRLVLCDLMFGDAGLASRRFLVQAIQLVRQAFGPFHGQTSDNCIVQLGSSGWSEIRREDISVQTTPTIQNWLRGIETHAETIIENLGADGWQTLREATLVLGECFERGILRYNVISAVSQK